MPLQPVGSQPAVFMFPASHSDPTLRHDAEVVRHVGTDRPFWGLAHVAAHRDLVRQEGVAALGARYVAQIQALQPRGPYLLYGNCLGGYLAWETARQLLLQGACVDRLLFYEVPLRRDYLEIRPGPMPVESPVVWRLAHYYSPAALPVTLTHIMTPEWSGARWWRPWRNLALRGLEAVLLPSEGTPGPERRASVLAEAIRAWCAADEISPPA